MEGRMAKIETQITHISNDISEIKKSLERGNERMKQLEIVKYRLQGMGFVLTTGMFIIAIKVFFFNIGI